MGALRHAALWLSKRGYGREREALRVIRLLRRIALAHGRERPASRFASSPYSLRLPYLPRLLRLPPVSHLLHLPRRSAQQVDEWASPTVAVRPAHALSSPI